MPARRSTTKGRNGRQQRHESDDESAEEPGPGPRVIRRHSPNEGHRVHEPSEGPQFTGQEGDKGAGPSQRQRDNGHEGTPAIAGPSRLRYAEPDDQDEDEDDDSELPSPRLVRVSASVGKPVIKDAPDDAEVVEYEDEGERHGGD